VFEHRLLFSSGIELGLVFRGFTLQRSRVAEPLSWPTDLIENESTGSG
jgi:hypothetical protein